MFIRYGWLFIYYILLALPSVEQNVNYSWLKGTKCTENLTIWPAFNQLQKNTLGGYLLYIIIGNKICI